MVRSTRHLPFVLFDKSLDHGNEWCARELTKDVIFCFDKRSGYAPSCLWRCQFWSDLHLCRYGGYGARWWGHGVRNILFKSPDPSIAPETWIRLEEGETRARIVLDQNYGRWVVQEQAFQDHRQKRWTVKCIGSSITKHKSIECDVPPLVRNTTPRPRNCQGSRFTNGLQLRRSK